jgi:acetylornithine deacetylase/succinyl-diaminopimelate desuccinylase-like protein
MKHLLILFLGLATAWSARAENKLTPYQQLGRDVFQELIETDTTHSKGDTTKAAEVVAKRFEAAGFPRGDIQIIGPDPTNKNLVLRYRGTGKRKPAILLAHVDVVEAKREDWSLDPFQFTEQDGFFYGRGTSDDKNGAALMSVALLRLWDEHYKPDRDLILTLTAGEEAAATYDGVEWLLEKHRDLVDGSVCFNADAGGVQKRHGKNLTFAVQAAEKVYQSVRLEAKGVGGHSSKPTKDNPIYRVAAALLQISKYDFPVKLGEITREYFRTMSAIETGETGADMLAIIKNPPDDAALGRISKSPFYNALLRTTAVATMIEGGHAENALPQRARAIVNCRLLPGESPDELLKTLKSVINDDQVSIVAIDPAKPSPPSPLSAEVVSAVKAAKQNLWPSLPILPVMEAGATDGLLFRQAGIPTYGLVGTSTDLDDVREHGKDERMEVKDFYEGLEFQYQFIKAISSGAP